MKSIFTFFILSIFPLIANAQIFIDGQPIEEVAEGNFIDVCTYQVPMSMKVKATVNYGQKIKIELGYPSTDRITDAEGNSIKFNSYIQVLNLFDENGYEYFGPSGGSDGISCYLFRRIN